MTTSSVAAARAALSTVSSEAATLGVFSGDVDAAIVPSTGERRRATRRGEPDPVHRANLFLNSSGVLEWHLGATAAADVSLRRRRAAEEEDLLDGDLVESFEFESLGANAVGAFLQRFDERMNPRVKEPARIWRYAPARTAGALPTSQPMLTPLRGKKRRLLFVHGTFSKSEALLEGIAKAPDGRSFLDSMFATYDEVLAFEHPTVSVSPVLNALDLSQDLAQVDGTLDIVAHSRGGLVTCWALEAFGVPAAQIRAVLVGSPLGGTSLASPPRLRSTLGLLTNFGTALQAAGAAASAFAPFLLAPMAILKVATSITGVVSKTPVLDGTIAMIPGLAAQSRIRNNPEVGRLRGMSTVSEAEYFVVTSDFQPSDPGWKFWQWFRGKRIQNAAMDKVFPGQNDLVVDTDSMSEMSPDVSARFDFRTNPNVHHQNYFEQNRTLSFVHDCLRMK